eukprot:TCONS_00024428-protein
MSRRRMSNSQDVFIACRVGDVRWLEKITSNEKEKQAALSTRDGKGFLPIHIAAMECKLDALKYLVEKLSCCIDSATLSGWTALHFSINNNKKMESLKCMDYLLMKGADIDRQTDHGMSALHLASSIGHIEEVRLLLKRGATVDLKDTSNRMAFIYATLWGHQKVARLLAHQMWFKQKNDKELSRQTFDKYSNELRKRFVKEKKVMKSIRQEIAETAYKEWHMKNDFIYNPYAFGQILYDRTNFQKSPSTRATSVRSISRQRLDSKTLLQRGKMTRTRESLTRTNDRSVTLLPLSDFYKTI